MQELTLAHANAFFENKLDNLLRKLTPDMQPLWGKMTPHHMVEHLAWVIDGAMGKWTVTVITPEEKLPRMRQFVFSNYSISQNFRHPNMPVDGELPLLNTPSIEAAIEVFWQKWAEFDAFMAANPGMRTNHVVFGPLNYDEWLFMQFKHVVHHLTQFGLTTLEAEGLQSLPPRPA
ncbi:MAG: DUF1569 domain-containing protein [Bacteroidetes bacterium]|nr:DUF1569 domain-containing protein [Bacteroidota bacterium]